MKQNEVRIKIISFQHKRYMHSDWDKYALGYKNASIILIDSLLKTKDNFNIDNVLLFPIFYSFRHFTELLMKRIIAVYNETEQKQINILKNHKLSTLFEKVKLVINDIIFFKMKNPEILYKSNFSEVNLLNLKETIDLLDRYDPDSMSFRFPIDPFGNKTLKESFQVPLESLKEKINITFAVLNHISLSITLANFKD